MPGPSMRFLFCFLLFTGLTFAQGGGGAGGGGGSTGGNAGGGGGGGNAGGARSNTQQNPQLNRRPVFLSGKVMSVDGELPNGQIKIERVCNGVARVEGYVDRKGNFGIELGRSAQFQDASIGGTGLARMDPFNQNSPLNPTADMGGTQTQGVTERELWNCEIRVDAPGYRSDSISLAGRHFLDSPDLGTIVIRPIAKTAGLTISATAALAPKDAKKAFEKGQNNVKKKKWDDAKADFEKAVSIYPRHAAAWYELGRLSEMQEQPGAAQEAYQKSLEADSKFMPPIDRLASLALKDSNWQELANYSDQFLRLDPYTRPDLYYLNSLANIQLKHFSQAERSARDAIRLDPAKKIMRSYYLLAIAQASQQDFVNSVESMKTFLAEPPAGTDLEFVRSQFAQMEEAAKESTGQAASQAVK